MSFFFSVTWQGQAWQLFFVLFGLGALTIIIEELINLHFTEEDTEVILAPRIEADGVILAPKVYKDGERVN